MRRTLPFAAALGLLALFTACERPAPPPAAASGTPSSAAAASPYIPVVTMKEFMDEVFEPAADHYWAAVGSTSDKNGTVEHSPKTAAEWTTVRDQATVLAEAGNVLLMEGRAVDRGEWVTFAREMIKAASRARDAAAAKDRTRVFDVGAELYDTCTNCHAKYMVQKYPMPDVRPVK